MIKISVHNNLRSLYIENVGTFVSPTSIKTAKFVRWLQLHIVWSRVDSTKVQPVFDHAPSIFVLWRKKQESDEYGNLAKNCTPTTAKRIRNFHYKMTSMIGDIWTKFYKLYNIVVCLRVQLTLPRLKGTLIDFTFTADRSCSNLTTTHSFRSIFAHPTIGVFYYVVKFIVIYGLLKSNVSPNRKIPKPTAWRDPCHSPL